MSFGKRKRTLGSSQVGDWKFSYQDRIDSFGGVGFKKGVAGLSAYAALFGKLERRLFARACAGFSIPSLKSGYISRYRVPARMFNSLRVSVEGKISAAREGQYRRVDSLERRIKRAKERITEAGKRGNLNVVHHKKRRLAALEQRFGTVKADVAAGRVRVCFGSRKLWRKQYSLEANGYSNHEEWLKDWREARSDEFFVMGSRDEKSGCQLCVATVRDDGKLDLRLRLPDALAGCHGKYLVVEGIHFNHGHAQVLAALEGGGQAVSYRFKRDRKGWRVFASVQHQPVAVVTERRLGAIGVDINVDHLAVSETDCSGNWLRSWSVPLVTYGKSKYRVEALVGDAVAELVGAARAAGKPLVIENLDFSKKRDLLEGESPRRSRMLSSFAYGRIRACFLSRGYREGVEVGEVNPAFSSVIGRVNFMERYGLSVHQAAALVLARRLLRCSERIPARRLAVAGDAGQVALRVPVGDGGHVDLCVPLKNRVKHVWSVWGAVSKQLRLALAEQRRQGGCISASSPARAGHPLALALAVSRSAFPGGISGQSRLVQLGRRRKAFRKG